ncbi:hypothetical protein [Weeksella virosa]|uniref:Uncharacterized protein n=1 Tax=Weeksella virosa (strain ATCC 43766 / DSM 16922 / JCM 21250 / CCUG 30538 / CDC 9751 / IAM 14551 / NBRC 16016 / NCTC 11634 / CL345/78) TaxID=865938 RepID=F0NX89_WEEVC|nr:hypothetical protein [Weeksella virosa]ADX66863.1 hypothetical protein Weevi_0137 [Weeksella virosa DSM 16922]MDK7675075.1 hypothetical protein [Weeksella virosa]VEH63413.1 Uncharacterised protein [Weeksella virosa]
MEQKKDSRSKALSVDNLLNLKFHPLEFEGKWHESFGTPDESFSAIVWGLRSNGKTSFAMQWAKYLTKFGRVVYNSLEEGASPTIQKAIKEHGMKQCGRKFILLDREPWEDMVERMKAHKSPQFLIVDSVQYTGATIQQYKELKEYMKQKKKGLIFISHAKGSEPKGALAEFISYDVDLKIPVKGYRAFPEGRLNGGGKFFDIWPEKSAKFYADLK